MGGEKGKWLRFEDGLPGSEVVSDNELTNNNRKSYERFREWCVDRIPAKERRIILIFLGVNSGKGKVGKRKQDKIVKKDENSTRKLLIESIMKSCTTNRVDGNTFFTASVVKCEDFDIKNVACLTEHEKGIEEKGNEPSIDSAKKILDKGGRIVDSEKISLRKRMVLGEEYICNQILNFIKNHLLIFVLICIACMFTHGIMIGSIFENAPEYIKKILECLNIGTNAIASIGIIYVVLRVYSQDVRKKVLIWADEETHYYRSLNYPVIFYNETGKTKRWIKTYIKRYLRGAGENKPSKPVFYIGAEGSKFKDDKIQEFVIPKGYPEWGLICLCKLVRDLADDPWGVINLKTDYANYNHYDDKRKDPVESKVNDSINQGRNRIQKFKLWDAEEYLAVMRAKLSKEYWSFCKVNRCKNDRMLCPIGSSVYVIYTFEKQIYYSGISQEIEKIWRATKEISVKYKCPPQIIFWIVIVDEEEQKNIDEISEIMSEIQYKDEVDTMSKNIWKIIIHIVMHMARENDFKAIKKFIPVGKKEMKDEDVENIVNRILKYNLYQEPTLKLDKE